MSFERALGVTNAVKAQIIALLNALVGVAIAFEWLSEGQAGAVLVALNAILSLLVGLTYQYSHKRVDAKE